ncbi:enoyl-(Acyl carrier protein) reductase domain-containing protein [Ditylenchus destructor]|nr:enoyl-(Acyl carrier protein) reductase domain-containing protein [Ditylenchus destructor]
MSTWFDLQRSIISDCKQSVIISFLVVLVFAAVILRFKCVCAMITIASVVIVTAGAVTFLGWEIGVLEGVILVLVVGLSFDYTLHYGASVADKGCAFHRIQSSVQKSTVPVAMAALSSVLAGSVMLLAQTHAFYQVAVFLVVSSCVSFLYATFFFLPLLYIFLPTGAQKFCKRCERRHLLELSYTIARRLGLAGAKVFLNDTDEKRLGFVLDAMKGADIDAIGTTFDITNDNNRKSLFEQIRRDAGKLDVLVIGQKPNQITGDIIQSTSTEIDEMFDKYLTAPFFTCQTALPLLETSGKGSIILMSSIAGFAPFVDIGLYSAAQSGVLGLCKALAQSLASRKIRVNSVCLGMFDDDGSGEQTREQLGSLIPLGRTAKANDCAGLVEFLASDQSSYITGENVVLSGGVSVRF